MMLDVCGRVIEIGDQVVYIAKTTADVELKSAYVVGFTAKKVRLGHDIQLAFTTRLSKHLAIVKKQAIDPNTANSI